MKVCDFGGCSNTLFAKGLCHGHYTQQWKGKALTPLFTRNKGKQCGFDGCGNPSSCKGLCRAHYSQRQRGQTLRPLHKKRYHPNTVTITGGVAMLELTDRRGVVVGHTKIDKEDVALVTGQSRWSLTSDGYVRNNDILLHRLLLDAPDDLQVDHINGDRMDNRRSNLRLVTCAENRQNCIGKEGRDSFRNISWRESRNKWEVTVMVDGVSHWVGRFDTMEQAKREARKARRSLFTHNEEERHK